MSCNASLPRGTARKVEFTIIDPLTKLPDPSYWGTDLSCVIWPGGNAAKVAEPDIAWLDPDPDATIAGTCKYVVYFTDSDTDLEPGNYRILITADGEPIDQGTFEITEAPGSGSPGKVYISYQDLLDHFPQIKDEYNPTRHQTGFLAQRVLARSKFEEEYLQGRYRPNGHPYGWMFDERPGTRSLQLAHWLDQDKLEVNETVKRVNAYLTAAIVYRSKMGQNPETYAKIAKELEVEADRAARSLVVRVLDGEVVLAVINLTTAQVNRA